MTFSLDLERPKHLDIDVDRTSLILPPKQQPKSELAPEEARQLLLLRGTATLSREVRLNVNDDKAKPIRENLMLLSEAIGSNDNREAGVLLLKLAKQLEELKDGDFQKGATDETKTSLRKNIPKAFKTLEGQMNVPWGDSTSPIKDPYAPFQSPNRFRSGGD